MADPKEPTPWQPDLWTGEQLDSLDLDQQKLWQREMFDQMFPLVTIKRLDRTKTQLDTLRGEPVVTWGKHGKKRPADRSKRFLAPIQCRAYVDHHPKQVLLLRYGFDYPRDVVFTFLDFVLKEDGIVLDAGDVVSYEDEDFELTAVTEPTESYWVNTTFKFYVIAPGQRYRTEGNRRIDYSGK